MQTALIVLIICMVLGLTIKRPIYGISLFLMIRILIPENVRMSFINVSLNTAVIFVVMLAFLVRSVVVKQPIRINRKVIHVVCGVVIYCIFSLLLSAYGDLGGQLSIFFQLLIVDILPFILLLMFVRTQEDVLVVVKAVLASCIIVSVYGFISYATQMNPYIDFWSESHTQGGAWYGDYTTSTFVSTNSLGYFIGFSIPFAFFCYKNKMFPKTSRVAIIVLLFCCVLAKKRTTIVVLIVYFGLMAISGNPRKSIKYVIYSLPVVIGLVVAIFTIPSLSSIKNVLISSMFFWNDSLYDSITGGIGGSTMGLRVRQMIYPFTEIKDNLLFGHGYGWCGWYLSEWKLHPILYGFESLLTQAICEFGLLAFVFYPCLIFAEYQFANNRQKDKYVLLFIIASLVQKIGTGQIYLYLELSYLAIMHFVTRKKLL